MRTWHLALLSLGWLLIPPSPNSAAQSLHGLWDDEIGDVTQRIIDLQSVSLYAAGPAANLVIGIDLAGLHERGDPTHSTFEMFWNTDNRTETGQTIGPFRGIEKILKITLAGWFPFAQPGEFKAELLDAQSNTSVLLAPGKVTAEILSADTFDSNQPPTPTSREVGDMIEQRLPLPLLGRVADQVQVGVRATNPDTGEADYAAFTFSFNPKVSPYLRTSVENGVSGTTVDVSGVRFSGRSRIQAILGTTEVFTATTQQDGSFSSRFTIPVLPAGDYLLAATDGRGVVDIRMFRIVAQGQQ